ncbi:HAD-IB family phosphatase [Pedobacter flavus]|uniref:D-3-phosphoglycerate dehydrogenase n=1 Tax=Pedobacter flavus TaxID=3113906 RepID=A0ABU7GYN1_9SPHI|nr:HAD-IB family phosphatase [Pedobacter sp. VNH31]MEE1884195.1 HAD-IB family phosphatase [Pedobacter sp. VNH31]
MNNAKKQTYIIDFDSTFTQIEAIDELAKISLSKHPNKEKIFSEIESLTNAAMEGKLSFSESLENRIKLLSANVNDLNKLISRLKKKVSTSFKRNEAFFKSHAKDVLIVSGGFKEFIAPVVQKYHIPLSNIYANNFIFNNQGDIIDYDHSNPLSKEGGKVILLNELNLEGDIIGIGDGYSDFQLRESGLIKKFYAFTENIARESITQKADHITPSFDEFLYVNNLPRAISYPKNRILCLVIGDIPDEATAILKKDGFSIRQKQSFEEKYVADVGMMLLGDNEKIDNEALRRANKLKVIGYLGNSSKKIDKQICTEKGIVIFDDEKQKKNNTLFIPKRMKDFINSGTTHLSSNFPNLQLPKIEQSHRLIHIHKNIPGIMARINTIFAEHEINIMGQYLLTNKELGYCITDVNFDYNKKVIADLKKIENTIKFRILY